MRTHAGTQVGDAAGQARNPCRRGSTQHCCLIGGGQRRYSPFYRYEHESANTIAARQIEKQHFIAKRMVIAENVSSRAGILTI
jgi:hypothetical protein